MRISRVASWSPDLQGVVVDVDVGVLDDHRRGLVEGGARRDDRAELAAEDRDHLALEGVFHPVAENLHLFVEGLHLDVDLFHLLVERLHVDVDLRHLRVERLHVDVDVGHLLVQVFHLDRESPPSAPWKGSMSIVDLSSPSMWIFHLRVDLALDVFEGAVFDMES